jgi:hypothetical protein
MDTSMQFLRDIHGLDPIGWWPPAIGWWLVAVLAIALATAGVWLWRTAPYQFEGWRWDARQRLKRLRRQVETEQPKAIAGELSELLRRIAIARCGRHMCAGITGPAWLDWLAENDPAGYDWRKRGQVLLKLPYAPPEPLESKETLIELIDAALAWVIKRDNSVLGGSSSGSHAWESHADTSSLRSGTASDV